MIKMESFRKSLCVFVFLAFVANGAHIRVPTDLSSPSSDSAIAPDDCADAGGDTPCDPSFPVEINFPDAGGEAAEAAEAAVDAAGDDGEGEQEMGESSVPRTPAEAALDEAEEAAPAPGPAPAPASAPAPAPDSAPAPASASAPAR